MDGNCPEIRSRTKLSGESHPRASKKPYTDKKMAS
jgi:hypothetical protein